MLLEREAALRRMQDDLAAARAGAGRTVLLSGEAGIGKTSLAEAFVRDGGARVLWGACEALSTPHPLGPLHDIARAGSLRLAPLLRTGGDRAALFEAVLEELAQAPTVLVIEDAHWADAATLDLVRFLGRRIAGLPALLVLTYRDDELDAAPALRAALGHLPARHVTRLPLSPLSARAVAELAERAGRDAAGLHQASGGNPFFVAELLAHPDEGVPATVRDAVLGRAALLDPDARSLLDLASIAPRAAEVELCEAVLGPIARALDACLASGLLREEGGMLRFRHELARVAVEQAVASPTSTRLHARVLACLEALPGAGLARRVHHALQARNGEAVLRLAPLAAREAAARGSWREAHAHSLAALRFADHLSPRARAELLDEFARHAFEANDMEAAIRARDEALALVSGSDAAFECDLWTRQAIPLARALRNAEADVASRRALGLAGDLGAGHQARAFATECYLRMLNRDVEEAIAWGDRAIDAAHRCGDREMLAAALVWSGAALIFVDHARGCERVRGGLEIGRELADGGVRIADAWQMLGTASGEVFELADAQRFLDEGLAFARTRDLDRLGVYMEAWRALVLLERGEWSAAGDAANAVLAREASGSTSRVMALVALGRLRVRRGDPGAGELLDEALELARRSGTLQRLAPVRALRAEAAWLAGDLAAARAEAVAAMELAREKSHPWFVGELASWLRRAGLTEAAPPGCAEPHALQLAGDWRGSADAWERRGCPYQQAMALAEGDGEARKSALAILERLGARPLADEVRRRMREAGLAVPRGARAATRANGAGLTTREMEVLRLLARGWQNARIAQELSRSPRTVEHHLEAILAKLEVGSRGEAVAAARERGLLRQDG
jgi:DNA-binding CsgD family transcriptional regulator